MGAVMPLLLHQAGSQTSAMQLQPGDVDWTTEYSDTCLNFSGQTLSQLPRTSLCGPDSCSSSDLSANGLQRLPGSFFRPGAVAATDCDQQLLGLWTGRLAKRCDLDLQADCSCVLLDWHRDRQDNCSGPELPKCLDVPTGAWAQPLCLLDVSCPSGLTKTTIGALAASGSLLLVLAIAGPVLAWRPCRHRMGQNLSKTGCSGWLQVCLGWQSGKVM